MLNVKAVVFVVALVAVALSLPQCREEIINGLNKTSYRMHIHANQTLGKDIYGFDPDSRYTLWIANKMQTRNLPLEEAKKHVLLLKAGDADRYCEHHYGAHLCTEGELKPQTKEIKPVNAGIRRENFNTRTSCDTHPFESCLQIVTLCRKERSHCEPEDFRSFRCCCGKSITTKTKSTESTRISEQEF
eukprot:m.90984 g.90984  ORF g.90984 m.90984 type:complete len:188 (-) comp13284_c1_seq1:208-771(-)